MSYYLTLRPLRASSKSGYKGSPEAAYVIERLVLRQGLLLAGTGAGLGALGALAVTRALSAEIEVFRSADGTVFIGALSLVLGAALLGTLAPAAQATKIDPIRSLGYE